MAQSIGWLRTLTGVCAVCAVWAVTLAAGAVAGPARADSARALTDTEARQLAAEVKRELLHA